MYRKEQIMALAATMVKKTKNELDICKVPEDLEELYSEITQALTEKGPQYANFMPAYYKLMRKEQDMYDPYEAYLAGRQRFGGDYWQVFMDYARNILDVPKNQLLLIKRDRLFYKMCDILGDDERRLLLTDFNEIFRQYHGIVGHKLNIFFDLGYFLVDEINNGTVRMHLVEDTTAEKFMMYMQFGISANEIGVNDVCK